ncbi:MAG TPA: hypothetical protein VGG39_01050 [Polyangiaceae bacterium]
MGPDERAAEELTRYRLGPREATFRARAAALVTAFGQLAPILLAVVLVERLGWAPGGPFWAVVLVLIALVVVRAGVGYGRLRRKLAALIVTASADDIHVETTSDGYSIARANVARIVEVDGRLGGLRVESLPDARSGVVYEANVPRGGTGYEDVRRLLEEWAPIRRRSRRGPAVRLAIGAVVVAAIFFVPFLLEDFVARSKVVAAALVAGMWLVTRMVLRRR